MTWSQIYGKTLKLTNELRGIRVKSYRRKFQKLLLQSWQKMVGLSRRDNDTARFTGGGSTGSSHFTLSGHFFSTSLLHLSPIRLQVPKSCKIETQSFFNGLIRKRWGQKESDALRRCSNRFWRRFPIETRNERKNMRRATFKSFGKQKSLNFNKTSNRYNFVTTSIYNKRKKQNSREIKEKIHRLCFGFWVLYTYGLLDIKKTNKKTVRRLLFIPKATINQNGKEKKNWS